MGHLSGTAVVITGAGSGLGAAYATAAADAGALVVINDIDAHAAKTTASSIPNSLVNTCDISTWDGAKDLIDHCVNAFGRIDGLVNNAGVIRVGPPQQATEDDFRRVIGVNLLGTAFCGTLALQRMIPRNQGSIVNVTSGAQAGMPTVAGYSASKGGITSLTTRGPQPSPGPVSGSTPCLQMPGHRWLKSWPKITPMFKPACSPPKATLPQSRSYCPTSLTTSTDASSPPVPKKCPP